MKKIKKYIALLLCVMMVASMAITANAASFGFYVDAVGGSNTSSAVTKSTTTSSASLNFSTFLYNGPSGGLKARVNMGSSAATSNYSLTSGGSKTWSYKSGYAVKGNSYKIYGYTSSSCGYGAQLGGTWTP